MKIANAENHSSCPCLHTTPCDPMCTCVKPHSSHGCRCCCSHGSNVQRAIRGAIIRDAVFHRNDAIIGKSRDALYAGIITALNILGNHDQETIFRELVAACDEKALIDFARRDGVMKFSYLSKYGYGRRKS